MEELLHMTELDFGRRRAIEPILAARGTLAVYQPLKLTAYHAFALRLTTTNIEGHEAGLYSPVSSEPLWLLM
jgi:hypothetical protein